MMDETTRKGLTVIAGLHDGKDYAKLTKAQLYEALKYARHIAKCVLLEDTARIDA